MGMLCVISNQYSLVHIWLGSGRCISLWRSSTLGHPVAAHTMINSNPTKPYVLGSVLTYSSVSMVSLTISSVLASRSLFYAAASTQHLEYMNRVSAAFNPHHIS